MNYIILLLLLLASCKTTPKSQLTTIEGTAMTINYKVTVGHPVDGHENDIIKNIISGTFEEINDIYNRWNPSSELSRLNKSENVEPLPISEKLYSLLQYAAHYVHLSEGRFDPTVEPLVVLWKERLEKNEIPSDEELAKVRAYVGWSHIHLDDHLFRKDNPLTQIDLGGIAKGFAVDLLLENLLKAGYKNLLVDWGGEIRATGVHPENRPWKVYISRLNDFNPEHALADIILEDEAIATSGDYNQYWTYKDGNATITYSHIINPLTGHPIALKKHSIASVSVLAPTCAEADALATAAMVYSDIDEARNWIAHIDTEVPHTEFWFVTRDNERKTTELNPPIHNP